jgi:heme A synthase
MRLGQMQGLIGWLMQLSSAADPLMSLNLTGAISLALSSAIIYISGALCSCVVDNR